MTIAHSSLAGRLPHTNAAFPPPLFSDVGVFGGVRMALRAMRRRCVFSRGRSSTQGVDLLRNRFQMVWPNTMPHAAKVIDSQSIWDRGNTKLVGPAMGIHLGPRAVGHAANSETTIAIGETFGSPQPTRIGEFHFRPETDSWFLRLRAVLSKHDSIVTPMVVQFTS